MTIFKVPEIALGWSLCQKIDSFPFEGPTNNYQKCTSDFNIQIYFRLNFWMVRITNDFSFICEKYLKFLYLFSLRPL